MIGSRIKEVRERNGLTQAELAKKLGLTRSGVNAWEMGISIPSAQYLIGLSKLFKVTVDYLLELDENEYINISSLSHTEKSIIYSLLNYFEENRHPVKISAGEYAELKEDYEALKNKGIEFPDYIEKILNEIFD